MELELRTQDLARELETDVVSGLSRDRARTRLIEEGPNALPEPRKINLAIEWLKSFSSPTGLILVAVAAFSFFLRDYLEGFVLLAVISINGIIGVYHVRQAEKTFRALKRLEQLEATVIRGGASLTIPAEEVVRGDVLILNEGDRVIADGRVLSASVNFRIDQSSITGESLPVRKVEGLLPRGTPMADRYNMVFRGSIVSSGNGSILVVSTGARTIIGEIALTLEQKRPATTIERKVAKVMTLYAVGVLGFALLTGLAAIFVQEIDFLTILRFATITAVAAIPEGMAIAISVAMTVGAHRLSKERFLIRDINAAASLGGISLLATDKTGTLTINRLSVRHIDLVSGEEISVPVPEEIEEKHAAFYHHGKPLPHTINTCTNDKERNCLNALHELLIVSALNHHVVVTEKKGVATLLGDPTETALVNIAQYAGYDVDALVRAFQKLGEEPFNYETLTMQTWHRTERDLALVTLKGAPESVLKMCDLTEDERKKWLALAVKRASSGYRTLGIASREVRSTHSLPAREGFHFLGIVSMEDPLRMDARSSILALEDLGIRVLILTGDHALTAFAIGKQLNLISRQEDVVEGKDLANATDEDIIEYARQYHIFARLSPDDKRRLIQVLQAAGDRVAVTGDGVNDAPAIHLADVGISLGSGSAVAQEVSQGILLDDHLALLPQAVKASRTIFQNVRNVVLYLFATSIAEWSVLLIAPLLGLSLPLTVLQILWLNLVTDGFLDIGLAQEPLIHPRDQSNHAKAYRSIFPKPLIWRTAFLGLTLGMSAVGLHIFLSNQQIDPTLSHTLLLILLAIGQWIMAFHVRSYHASIFVLPPWRNKAFMIALGIVAGSSVLLFILPATRLIFDLVIPSWSELGLVGLFLLPILLVEEIRKVATGIIQKRKKQFPSTVVKKLQDRKK